MATPGSVATTSAIRSSMWRSYSHFAVERRGAERDDGIMGNRSVAVAVAVIAACGSSSNNPDAALDAAECAPTGAPGPVTVFAPPGGTTSRQVTFVAHDA